MATVRNGIKAIASLQERQRKEVNMAEEQVEPTISLNEKQFKHLLADVRGENNSCFLSMGEDSHDSLNFGGVQSDMRPFGQQFHYVSSSQSPTSTSPQPSYSPQPPAYPQNIPASYSPTSTPANRNSSISPISNSPYDNCNTYNDGSATASSSSPQGMYMSRLPTIPSTTEYPGDWGFEISFGPLTESASKSATWTYSDVCKKLYVNLASFCPIKFKTRMQPPSGTVLRAVAVFKGSTNLHDVVKRCPNHMESSSDGSAPKDQFIRSNNPAAHYHTCPESMRHSVMLPYNGPQVGTEFVTEMFAFMCFSSCASGPSRRPVEVIFTLEKDGQTLGRRVVEIRVCACPGRDRKSDEKAVCGEPTSSQGVGKRARRGSGNKGPGAKRRRTSSRTSSEEEYVVTTRNRHVYELLMDFKEKLEDKFEYFHLQNLDNSLVLSTSEDETEQPSTSAGSPGSVFKRGGLSTM
ncbi:cellular tumor antigen p53-like isoform X3 [Montipora foliosa]|uniref:cellular tumor antigen p53-like isoform X3 n=1 Tax=Montipora foliosa TaxID=591990 RepID=UPI0035F14CBC